MVCGVLCGLQTQLHARKFSRNSKVIVDASKRRAETDSGERQMPPKSSTQFGRTALPFLAMMGLGSWGLAQFLKMPIDVKDARAKDKRENKEKFDLAKEHEVRPPEHAAPECHWTQMDGDNELTSRRTLPAQRFKSELGDKVENYENVKIPGAKNPYRVAAD